MSKLGNNATAQNARWGNAVKGEYMNATAREKLGIKCYDSADYLQTQQDMEQYFEACLEMGEPALIQEALGAIDRARIEVVKHSVVIARQR
jgi:DNA-binding phage protein